MQDARCIKQWLEVAGLTAAAWAAGWVAWGGEVLLTPLAILLPMAWATSKTRVNAFVVAMAYYLAAGRVIPESSSVFFGESTSLQMGLVLWVMAASIQSSVWALLWARQSSAASLIARFLLVEALLILPPVGIIGWTNPFMGAAVLFPGMGWAAILLGSAAIWSTMMLARAPSNKTISMFLLCAVTSGWAHAHYREPIEPEGWIAFSTRMGRFPDTLYLISERIVKIGEGVRVANKEGFNIVIFPEQILGRWDDRFHPSMLRTEIGREATQDGAIIMLGTEIPISNSAKAENALVILSKKPPQIISARQPVPVSMWRPWASDGIVSDWWKTGVHEIDGIKVSFSFCYEDFLSWPILSDFAMDKPQAIISVANGWWVQGTVEQKQQAQHVHAWGKVFGVPVLRAVNAS